MNIKQAKQEILHTVAAYLAKDELGEYKIPSVRQRPILLIGLPGIGKTQIMEQIALECQIGLVAYTITHHTRQSAVGLPFIKEKNFDGKSYSVTEYTMSEIISSVYQKIEDTGCKEGILFIDEINCVSETLAPTMLQFLQCKTFGNQSVPKGWIIVAAGNPPEYNKSVREFDMVTLDRVRCIEVEANYRVWKEYARENHVHSALLGYLELKQKNFYRVEADVDGMQYVTARGWEDLSSLLKSYEELNFPVSREIVYEYLHHRDVAEDVAAYIDLYRKYQDDYGIEELLQGRIKPDIFARIYAAAFDERLSVVNLLLDGILSYMQKVYREKYITDAYFAFLKSYRTGIEQIENPLEDYEKRVKMLEEKYAGDEKAGFVSKTNAIWNRCLLQLLKEGKPVGGSMAKEVFEQAKAGFDKQREVLEQTEKLTKEALEYAFDFMEQAFENGEEMVVFVTELTVNKEAAAFLAEHTCERYQMYNQQLLIGSRKRELLSELNH
ncbi:MAG: AAA family ATPase [Lachnospiraceae bacterium]|nr:AAA family ATPase [Lachnospiraceae bacterium]